MVARASMVGNRKSVHFLQAKKAAGSTGRPQIMARSLTSIPAHPGLEQLDSETTAHDEG
jgi:hypothetical protein